MKPNHIISQPASMQIWNEAAQQVLALTAGVGRGVTQQTISRPDFQLMGVSVSSASGASRGSEELLLLAPDLFVVCKSLQRPRCQSQTRTGDGLIEFHFRLSGSVTRKTRFNPNLAIHAGSFLISRLDPDTVLNEAYDLTKRDDSISVFCTPSFMRRCFGDYTSTLRPDLADVLSDGFSDPIAMRVTIYPRLAALAQQLINSNFTTPKRLVHAESIVRVIICEILAVLENAQKDCAQPQQISDQDFIKLHAARDILVARHTPPPTIEDLAREVGLGTTKLKLGFRNLFGKSVFAYAQELRMALARDLLRQPNQSIQSIAAQLGYEYQHSFTVAFQNHFGILPKVFRRSPSSFLNDNSSDTADPDQAFGIFSQSTHAD